jgi:hypothetical protein
MGKRSSRNRALDKELREQHKTTMTIFGWSPVRGKGVHHPEHGIVERGRDGKLATLPPSSIVRAYTHPEYVDWGAIKTRTISKLYTYLVERKWI